MKACANLLIAYGSQTGQAKAIASILEKRLRERGLATRLHCLDQNEKEFNVELEDRIVFVVSTTGDGDPPDNAQKFFLKLKSIARNERKLDTLKFALLGLGDSNYNTFCGSPKRLEQLLLRCGASSFYPTAFCDDAVGTDIIAEPWLNGLVDSITMKTTDCQETLSKLCLKGERGSELVQTISTNNAAASSEVVVEEKAANLSTIHDDKNCDCVWSSPCLVSSDVLNSVPDLSVPSSVLLKPWLKYKLEDENHPSGLGQLQYPGQGSGIKEVVVVENRVITAPEAEKQKCLLKVDIGSAHFDFLPGDSFCFLCPNPADEVQWLLQRLRLTQIADKRLTIDVMNEPDSRNAHLPKHLPNICSLRQLFTHYLDIRQSPSRLMIRMFAEQTDSVTEKRRLMELCSSQGMKEYQLYVRQAALSLLDILHAFPACQPPFIRLMELLPRLKPRPYSVAGSPLKSNSVLSFVYSVQKLPVISGRFYPRAGIATGYLSRQSVGSKLLIYFKESSNFRLTNEMATVPIVMIGTGTGVAPYVGFLEHLQYISDYSVQHTERWLFFGCQRADRDYIFMNELEGFKNAGLLSHLSVAFSKGSPARHVQDEMLEVGDDLARLIMREPRSRIYVCGDVEHMTKSIFETFVNILMMHYGMGKRAAIEFMIDLQTNGRYILDYWI